MAVSDGAAVTDSLYRQLCLMHGQNRDNPVFGTSSVNLLLHVVKEHEDTTRELEDGQAGRKQQKLMPWLTNFSKDVPSLSQYEFSSDLGVMLCHDLLLFNIINKPGFSQFVKKNCQHPILSTYTLSSTVLTDIYSSMKSSLIELLNNVTAATVMMDGWIGKYNVFPYFAIRLSTIID